MIAVQVATITIQQSLYRNPCGEVVAAPPHGRKKRYLTPLIITRALASCHGNLSDHLNRNQVSALWVYTRFGPKILAEHVGRTFWPKSSSLPVLAFAPCLCVKSSSTFCILGVRVRFIQDQIDSTGVESIISVTLRPRLRGRKIHDRG